MAGVLNDLGQSIIPSVFSSLNAAGLMDTLNVQLAATTTGAGGGTIKSGTSNAYSNVPCSYTPFRGQRTIVGEKSVSYSDYKVEMPTVQNGSRINLDPKAHRLIVAARGLQPAITFRIDHIRDDSGVVFIVECTKEN